MKDPKDTPAKSPWAKKKLGTLVNPGPYDLVDAKVAVAFIVQQLDPPKASRRRVGDLVHKRVVYALDHGLLQSDSSRKIQFGDLITWGRSKDEWCTALASFPSLNAGGANVALSPLQGGGGGRTVPADPDAKDAALREAFLRIHELEVVINAQASELDRLRLIEAEDDRLRSVASTAGKTGGRPSKR